MYEKQTRTDGERHVNLRGASAEYIANIRKVSFRNKLCELFWELRCETVDRNVPRTVFSANVPYCFLVYITLCTVHDHVVMCTPRTR